MTGKGKQKIRLNRPEARRAEGQRPEVAEPAEAERYFGVRPATLGPRLDRLSVLTKPGVRGFPGVDAAQALLMETMRKDRVRGEVLDLTAMGGLLGSLQGVTLRAVEGAAAALTVLKAAGFDAHAAAPGDELRERWPERPRTVALVLAGDRGNAYAFSQVAWAHASTPPGGTLYIAGDRDKGFDRYVRAAGTAFGTGETIARDGGMRVAKLIRRPGPTPAFPEPEGYEAFGVRVVGLPGVFSAARPDKATTLLLETLAGLPLEGKHVLDLGTGTGLIGAWAAGQGAQVTLVDGDLQSVRSARATLAANGLHGEVIHSDVDAELGERTFDAVLTNPPFHVGRGVVLDVAREFIATAARRLNPGGTLYLVANEPLPYEAAMREVGAVRELRREGGFKVVEARRA
ncbi:class I SAM-dependent methyltransferase [Deinococcus hopiensis]|uniref:16S rRNA (Guanine1207-N2)-methyltransferase n=1 Tax=Deinococcus hopiensis KR-140 TaxID=695939 RepID=A0A1W1VMS2_9DEIO|nr:class I SAM-dependent methyltransferase [Deinococcus hopiensis]SMB94626.1 16S rRNA (guanine1207-N2)-methyltransferase [Deinococcus hopiensis KR-140]